MQKKTHRDTFRDTSNLQKRPKTIKKRIKRKKQQQNSQCLNGFSRFLTKVRVPLSPLNAL